jgi:hypothetical protein
MPLADQYIGGVRTGQQGAVVAERRQPEAAWQGGIRSDG